jgi:hypothetical protein
MKTLLFTYLFINLVFGQSSSRIGNIGYGVFLIIFSIVLAGVLCLLGRATRYPEYNYNKKYREKKIRREIDFIIFKKPK